jgi:hypothetical protein
MLRYVSMLRYTYIARLDYWTKIEIFWGMFLRNVRSSFWGLGGVSSVLFGRSLFCPVWEESLLSCFLNWFQDGDKSLHWNVGKHLPLYITLPLRRLEFSSAQLYVHQVGMFFVDNKRRKGNQLNLLFGVYLQHLFVTSWKPKSLRILR